MSRSSDYGSLDAYTLSDRSLYDWLESQDDGWKELPGNRESARPERTTKRKRLSRISNTLRSLIQKRRRHAYQPV